jgi:hypothetical protein
MPYAVLWGIWPAIVLGACVSHMVYNWRLRPLQHFKAQPPCSDQFPDQLCTCRTTTTCVVLWGTFRSQLYRPKQHPNVATLAPSATAGPP